MLVEIAKLILTFILGFISKVLFEKVKQKKKSISYQIFPRFPLQGFGFYPTAEGKDVELAGVWEFSGYTVAIENDGNEVIENQDISFVFENNSVIWKSFVGGIPEGIAIRVQELPSEKANIKNYKVSFLNPGKKFKETLGFNFTVYNTKAIPKIVAQAPNLVCHPYSVGSAFTIGFYIGSIIDILIGILMVLYFSNLLFFQMKTSQNLNIIVISILFAYVSFSLGYRFFAWWIKKRRQSPKSPI